MYYLFLVALLQTQDAAPRPISPPTSLADCQKEAREMNKDPRLQSPEAKEMGLRFVCMTFASDT